MFPFDITSVMTAYNKGWILEKISNIILSGCKSRGMMKTSDYFLVNGGKLYGGFPYSKSYLFMHYKHFYELAPQINLNQHSFIWFTHYEPKHKIEISDLVSRCNLLGATILTPCLSNKNCLIDHGLDKKRVHVVYGGYDHELKDLETDAENARNVCVVGGCYERKRPQLILDIAKNSPNYRFFIIGPDPATVDNKSICWSNSSYYRQILDTPNITLVECEYSYYRNHMQRCGIYLMLSEVEGGPLGLMEAMAMGLYPIATPTGFVNDLLEGPLSELIVSHDLHAHAISSKLDLASRMLHLNGPKLPKSIVSSMDWNGFSNTSYDLISEELCKMSANKTLYIYAKARKIALSSDAKLKSGTKAQLESYLAYNSTPMTPFCSNKSQEFKLLESCYRMLAV